LQVAKDVAFAELVIDEKQRPGVSLRLDAGVHHWRLVGAGGEPLSEERQLTVVRDEQPALFRPRAEEVVDRSMGAPLFADWTPLRGVERYQVELAAGSQIVASRETNVAQAMFEEPLGEGRYCARVRGLAERELPWSSSVCFRVVAKPVLEAPVLQKPKRESLPPPVEGKGTWLWRLLGGVAYAADESAIVLRWRVIPGAVAYIVEVAEEPTFARPVVKERVAMNYYRWHAIARRDYYWRVRGVDAEGREGEVSAPLIIEAEAKAAQLEAPAQNATLPAGTVTFKWKAPPVAKSFVLEIGKDERFDPILKRVEVGGEHVQSITLGGGTYVWRVRGTDAAGAALPAGEARKLVVLAEPPRVRAKLEVAAEHVPVAVPLDLGAVRFELELSRESSFKKASRSQGRGPSHTLSLTEFGPWFYRVRATDPLSSWSETASVQVVRIEKAPASTPVVEAAPASVPVVAQAVSVPASAQAVSAPASVQAAPIVRERVHIGGEVAFFSNLAAVAMPAGALHAMVRVPVGRVRLGALAKIGYYTAGTEVSAPIAVQSRLHALLAQVGFVTSARFGSFELYGAAGPVLQVAWVTNQSAALIERATATLLGALASVGGEYQLGWGAPFCELSAGFNLPLGRQETVELSSGLLLVGIGFRLGLL
jgi:hypothetical protein